MPLAVALLCHPLGTFAALLAAIVASLYAAQSHRFVPTFTAAAAALLTLLAFLQVPPSGLGLAALSAALTLLHVEFLWPAWGIAGVLGGSAAAWGWWLQLAALGPAGRGAAALAGTLVLVAAIAHTMRLRTLPSRRALP